MYTVFQTETGGEFSFPILPNIVATSGYILLIAGDATTYWFDGAVVSGNIIVPKYALSSLPAAHYVASPRAIDSMGKLYFLDEVDLEVESVPDSTPAYVIALPSIFTRIDSVESNKENNLGLPAVSGYILASTLSGHRYWVADSNNGITDHGLLTGLADDDHLQYHNDIRGDTRYWRLSTDLATQTELDAHSTLTTGAHGGALSSIGIYNAKAYGALGDGTTDDRAAIQSALDAAKMAGGGVVFLPQGTYLIKRPLFLGSKVTLQGSGRGATTITKPATIKSLLTANAIAGATSVTVTSATGFVVGGPIHLSDTSSYEWLSTQGTITGIAGNVITFTNAEGLGHTGLDGALQTGRSATAYTSFPLIRNDLGAIKPVVWNLTLDQNKNANDPAQAVYDFTLGIIHWVEAYNARAMNCELLNACADAYSDQAQDGTNLVVAANLIKTTKNVIAFCDIQDANRHATHLGTCMNGALVADNRMTNCGDDGSVGIGYALFYCAYVTNTIATSNHVEGCGQGFSQIDERDTGNVIANNQIRNCRTWAISANGAGTGGHCTIANNGITGGRGIQWSEPDSTIIGNVIEVANNQGISLTTTADRVLVVGNNIYSAGVAGTQGILLTGCDDVRLVGNNIRGTATGVSVRGCLRLDAAQNDMSGFTNKSWYFEVSPSTDCSIVDRTSSFSALIDESGSTPVRLLVNGMGDNGAANPASAGNWNVTGRKYDGAMVHWNDGADRISIYRHGAGWIQVA